MRIDLTITMGEDSKIMSLDEARGLYLELDRIFGNKVESNPYPIDQKIYRSPEPEDRPREQDRPKRDDTHGANPKVEAARNRAAKATSGCGSRR